MAPDPSPVPASATLAAIRDEALCSIAYADDHACPDAGSSCSAHNALRLLVAVERVLELHARQDKPVRSWDLDLRCAAHDWTRNTIRSFDAVRDCPDCRYSEYYACSHCRCPDDAWPCPTVLAITAALTGDSESEPPQTEADRRAADEALEALRAKLAGEG